MRFGAGDDGDRRRAEQPVRLDVPSRALEHGVARRGERGNVSDGRPGDERAGALARKPEHVQ